MTVFHCYILFGVILALPISEVLYKKHYVLKASEWYTTNNKIGEEWVGLVISPLHVIVLLYTEKEGSNKMECCNKALQSTAPRRGIVLS